MNFETIKIKDYLNKKGIIFREQGGELVTHCLFSGCDKDSVGTEAHLSFSAENSQYHCKKCGAKGNIVTLARHLGDTIKDVALHPSKSHNILKQNSDFNVELVESCHKALPDSIRNYLNDRGITDSLIEKYKLGWGKFYGESWITIPIKDTEGSFTFFKLRQNPENGTNKMTYPKGITAQLYDWETLDANTEKIIICEGELDRLLLISKDIPAVTGTHGATTFKKEWAEKVSKCKQIYICYDNDDAGREGAERVAKAVASTDNNVYLITLPENVGEHGDITDYFIKLNGNADDLFSKYAKQYFPEKEKPDQQVTRYKMSPPTNNVSFSDWEKTINETFPEFTFLASAGISVISQLLIKDITNPFGLVYADVPSSGKTIVLNFFSDSDIAYTTDSFTPASFVSQAANISKEKLAEVDLLPKIRYKTLIVRDLAPMFGLRGDDLTKSMGILTRVFDGEGLFLEGGVHGHRGYKGDYLFMFLAASTPISQRLWKMMGNMGSRLYFLNVNSRNKTEKDLAQQIMGESVMVKEKICRAKTTDFIASLWEKYLGGIEWNKQKDDPVAIILIGRAAMLLAKLRGVVSVWEGKGEDYEHESAVIEKPDRINQNLYNLARGHALMRGSDGVGMEDIPLILQVALNSTAPTRAKLFKILLENNGKLKSSMVMNSLLCSRQTALKSMKTLAALQIANYDFKLEEHKIYPPENGEENDFTITIKSDFHWFLSEEFKNLTNKNTASDEIN